MNSILQLLEIRILGNTLERYLLGAAVFLGMIIVIKIVERVVLKRVKQLHFLEKRHLSQFLSQILEKNLLPLAYYAAFYTAVTQLELDPALARFIRGLAVIVLTLQITKLILAAVTYFVSEIWARGGGRNEAAVVSTSILTILKLGIWGLAVIFVLDNLGFNVSAIIAGLGIGGIAVALAAQTILGDLFNYFVIFFDRPFVVGDFIITGDFMGTVEKIGIKTTRLRSLGGELIIMSNTDLTSSRVRNYKRMAERRVVFKFGVVYQTAVEQLKGIPETVRKIIEGIPQTRFDRAHFLSFAESSLDFEIVYYVLSPDYNLYMDIQQKINLSLKEIFEKSSIEFAYPTQTVYEYQTLVKK